MRAAMVLVVGWSVLFAGTLPAAEGCRMFLKLPGIDGEATFHGEAGWIALTRIKIGPYDEETGEIVAPIMQALPNQITGPSMHELGSLEGMGVAVAKEIDSSSPQLLAVWRGNRSFPEAFLCIVGPTDDQEILYRFTFNDVHMVRLGETTVWEDATLNFQPVD